MSRQVWMHPGDLAPGDAKSASADMSRIEFRRIESPDDPFFEMAFGALWTEFGESGELEPADVLAARMRRDPSVMRGGQAMHYEMVLLTCGGEFAAVTDQTAFVSDDRPDALVHISHNLVAPAWRRTGLAGWLRALPVATARRLLALHGHPAASPITLVGEVEPIDHAQSGNVGRLRAYEKAGFLMIDPARVNYLQPDFRSPAEIDATGGPTPVPLCLVLRHVGVSGMGGYISGAETLRIVRALYSLFALDFRPQDMRCVFESLSNYPAPDARIALVLPTAA